MLISFSIPEMRPLIEAGIRQAKGEDVGKARTKRQTIRKISGPTSRYLPLIENPTRWILNLQWLDPRNAASYRLGDVPCKSAERIKIEHKPTGDLDVTLIRETGPFLQELIYADGFDDLNDFVDFFVPNPGDVFNGVLIKW